MLLCAVARAIGAARLAEHQHIELRAIGQRPTTSQLQPEALRSRSRVMSGPLLRGSWQTSKTPARSRRTVARRAPLRHENVPPATASPFRHHVSSRSSATDATQGSPRVARFGERRPQNKFCRTWLVLARATLNGALHGMEPKCKATILLLDTHCTVILRGVP